MNRLAFCSMKSGISYSLPHRSLKTLLLKVATWQFKKVLEENKSENLKGCGENEKKKTKTEKRRRKIQRADDRNNRS